MKKHEVKVLIGSKKDLKSKRATLNELGEKAEKQNSCGWFDLCEFIYYNSKTESWESGSIPNERFHELKEISIRDLIIMLTKQEEEKVNKVMSTDGVMLITGDKYWVAVNHPVDNPCKLWTLEVGGVILKPEIGFNEECTNCKIFSTKEAALKWIELNNKVSSIRIELPPNNYAIIDKADVKKAIHFANHLLKDEGY